MSVCEPDCRTKATYDPDVGALGSAELQHDLFLIVPSWTSWDAISARLVAAGAELQSLQIARQNDGFSIRCRVRQLSEEGARLLSARLLDEDVASCAAVEHLVLRSAAA
jgi:hypothetical protein